MKIGLLSVRRSTTLLTSFTDQVRIALSEALKADHGFNGESRSIRELIELMTEFDSCTRRNYLQFITGSPKLPIGGSCPLIVLRLLPFMYFCSRVPRS